LTAIAFLNSTYTDALTLLVEARNYITYRQDVEERGLSPSQRVRISFETMRLTTRLTQAMAWLLAQRAVQQGEFTQSQAVGPEYALGGHDICLDVGAHDQDLLPEGLRSLLDRSLELYRRVDRLERQIKASLGEEDDPLQRIG